MLVFLLSVASLTDSAPCACPHHKLKKKNKTEYNRINKTRKNKLNFYFYLGESSVNTVMYKKNQEVLMTERLKKKTK